MFKIKHLLLCTAMIANTTGSAVDLSKFNAAFHNLKKWRDSVQVSKYTACCSDSDGDEHEVTIYRASTSNPEAQVALDNYHTEYHNLNNALGWRNLKTGAATGLATLAATKVFNVTTSQTLSHAAQIGAIGVISALCSYNSCTSKPKTPYYTEPALEESENIFATTDSHTLSSMLLQVVAATLVNFGGDALISKLNS